MKNYRSYFALLFFSLTLLVCQSSGQFTAREIRGPAAIIPIISEPAAKLIVDPPLKEPLQSGKVIIQYRSENLRIIPLYGSKALEISPRIGHIHVTVDDAPWHWADASNEPIIIVGLKEGSHRILIELADPTHKVIDSKTISFTISSSQNSEISNHR